MDDLLSCLMELASCNDPAYREAIRRAAQSAELQHDQLCAAMGKEKGEEIWSAVLEVAAAEGEPLFLGSLRTGIRLMALCFL